VALDVDVRIHVVSLAPAEVKLTEDLKQMIAAPSAGPNRIYRAFFGHEKRHCTKEEQTNLAQEGHNLFTKISARRPC
jgi:hypothetical protein